MLFVRLIFGQEQSTDAKAIANSVSVVFENLRAELLYLSLWRKLPFPRSRRWDRAVKTLNTTIRTLIAKRRSGSPEGADLLGLLLAAKDENGEGISDEYAHDEVITMFVAGQETSAVALSWAIALLAQHPEFQEEAEDYPRLRFLNAVVHETLRLYPPLWNLEHSAIQQTMVGDLPIHAGTQV